MIGRGNGKPGTHSVPGYSHARRQSPAQRAAIEKSLSYYLQLECGHYVAKEVRELYRVFGNLDIFCEICDNWIPAEEHVTKRDYPDNPLF